MYRVPTLRHLLVLGVLACFTTAMLAQAGPPQVTDLTSAMVNEEKLIEALKSRLSSSSRGARSMLQTTCAPYREQMSRGIRPAAVSEEVALQVEFASDSSELTPEAEQQLNALGSALGSRELGDDCFRIGGHTDSQHTEAHNLQLSKARSKSVARYLQQRFEIDPDRLITEAFGESQPLAPNETAQGRQKNRRVQIANLGARTPESGAP